MLLPLQGSKLPVLQQARLNAPRILRVHKVASYVITKLAEQGVELAGAPVMWGQSGPATPLVPGSPALELLCNGMVPYKPACPVIWRVHALSCYTPVGTLFLPS